HTGWLPGGLSAWAGRASRSWSAGSRGGPRWPSPPAIRERAGPSVPAVAFLFPGITMNVVAELFPEPRLVFLHEPKPADPLGALPEIEMRHDQSRRPAMHRLERLVVELVGNERLPLRHFVEGNIGRVAAGGIGHHDLAGRVELNRLEQGIDADAEPLHVELGPLGNTADVNRVGLGWQLCKLSPLPGHRLANQPIRGE